MALQIELDKLKELPVPFMTYLKKGGWFMLVMKVTASGVHYLSDGGKEVQKPKEEFLNEWHGVVLLAEASELSGEKNYAVQRKKERLHQACTPFTLLACCGLVVLFSLSGNQNGGEIWSPLLSLLKLAGTVITGLLLWYEIDKTNPVLQ